MKKVIDACLKYVSSALDQQFGLNEITDKEFAKISLYHLMNFKVSAYQVRNLGHLSMMTTNMGMMQMFTVVITPMERDLPLLSIDYIYAPGKRTVIIELYDLVLDKGELYKDVLKRYQMVADEALEMEDATPEESWMNDYMTVSVHRKGTREDDRLIHAIYRGFINTYISQARSSAMLSEEAKENKMALLNEYVEHMLEEGGVSTNMFKKCLGKEKTERFFRTTFFGVGE